MPMVQLINVLRQVKLLLLAWLKLALQEDKKQLY